MSESGGGCRFTFDGREVEAQSGQTLAGALHDAGQHVLSRSFKYHRPRGLFCVSGRCPNCLCTVNGEPNVRICTRPADSGMNVESQNRWPSLNFDVMSLFDKMHRFLPVGFYYKTMHKPRFAWPLFEKFIRRVAGLGNVNLESGHKGDFDKLNLFNDVAVVGGGWSGMHAALAAADAGASVSLIDDQSQLGGHLQYDPELAQDRLAALVQKVTDHERIEIINDATAFGFYEENYLGIQQRQRLIRLRAERVVVATGGWERPYVFENNDLPGNLLASGAQRLLQSDGCRLDGDAVVVTNNESGYRVARQLQQAGTNVEAVVDLRRNPGDLFDGVSEFPGHSIVAARGRTHVEAAVIEPLIEGPRRLIPCRWIVQAIGFTPATSLLYQSGCKLQYDPQLGHARVTKYSAGTDSAGSANGFQDLGDCARDAQRAGTAAATDAPTAESDVAISPSTPSADDRGASHQPGTGAQRELQQFVAESHAPKKFVCLCEDVTEKDLRNAIDEGYSNIETLKRYSTVSMGPCQGKMCQATSIAVCADHKSCPIADVGTTTSRPPEQPVPLGVLAGRSVHFSLTQRTPLHHWHSEAGATFLDSGSWKRPEHYGNPDEEYQAVRGGVGLVDVSTLGKIELQGGNVVDFLEFIYPNRFRKLKVGRVRYGVICDDAGMILDDGTIARLDDERFFLTTTTGNADAVDGWFRWWLACKPELDVRMTNVTSCYAAMNIAGPQSREVLSKLCDVDLSTDTIPYLAAKSFEVAGVPAVVLRIGFVGELGYEIHVPTQFGLHVWTSLMQAGEEFGIRPFGVEAQRRLRLDKKHLLAGHDTDALSDPFGADLSWIVKLDKPDFIGRWSLEQSQQRGPTEKLVGFRIEGNIVPDEASLVIQNDKLAGRVTSSRYSPVANATVGLAWIPVKNSESGDTFQIQVNGKTVSAVVQHEPFYDAAGAKLNA